MTELDVWTALADELAAGGPCGLLVVARSQRHSPARPGMLMAVAGGGPIAGTLGGDPTEDVAVARAAVALRDVSPCAELLVVTGGAPDVTAPGDAVNGAAHDHHPAAPAGDANPAALVDRTAVVDRTANVDRTAPGDPAAAGAGRRIPGGDQGEAGAGPVLLLLPLTSNDLQGVRRVVTALTAGRSVEWCADPGGWRVVMEGLGPQRGLAGGTRHWSYAQTSGPTHGVHLVGAGPVTRALAGLLVELEFRVVVVEERPDVDLARVPAHERLRLAFEDLASVVPTGPTSFVTVLGHSPQRSAVALAALESLELGYLGVVADPPTWPPPAGAAPAPAWLHAPMGLPIGAATPVEVAVAIAAELVAVRATATPPA